MPIFITRDDITKMQVDAIVNAANNSLLGGGGVDGAIHRAAGKELLQECITLHGCSTGDAKLTKGYNLPAKYVIHTVGPIWRGGANGEKDLLISCYRKSIEIAQEYNCQSIAFPLISSGAYGYPKDEAFAVAYDTLKEYINGDMTTYIVIFEREYDVVDREKILDLRSYIKVKMQIDSVKRRLQKPSICNDIEYSAKKISFASAPVLPEQLFDIQLDESFAQALLRMIDEKGMTDAQCYKKANIDRKLFSKIRSDKDYHPSKHTAIALAIALQLSLSETCDLLQKAGYALSHSNLFDIIIEYHISHKIYDVYEINKILFSYDQKLLGC